VAAVVYWALREWLGPPGLVALAVLCLLAVTLGVRLAPQAEAVYGRPDPRRFVLDELAGYWLACLLFWWRSPASTAVAVFCAFRFFDIAKPFPLRKLESLPGGWGVMADDLGAGVYAAATLWPLCYGVVERLAG
jgi:phosphatidylglycerophosphatase A